jgi:hypothetical protein
MAAVRIYVLGSILLSLKCGRRDVFMKYKYLHIFIQISFAWCQFNNLATCVLAVKRSNLCTDTCYPD